MRPAPLIVVYDDACTICRVCRTWCEARTTRDDVRFVSCGSEDHRAACAHVSREECRRALVAVRVSDGRVWTAHEAVNEVLRRIPRWRVLSPLMDRVGVVRALAAFGYRRVADGRHCHGSTEIHGGTSCHAS